jgi:putative NADH-flavin reductase
MRVTVTFIELIRKENHTSMKNILLLGATGFVGQVVLSQLLLENYQVTVLVRETAKKISPAMNLKIIIGNVLNETDIQKSLENQDVVIDCLGTGANAVGKQNTLTSDAIKIVVKKMEENKIRRLICMSNVGTIGSKSPWFFRKIIIPIFLRRLIPKIKDKERLEKIVKNSILEYTIIYFQKIKNSNKSKEIKISTNGKGVGYSITVVDCAKFLISQIEDIRFLKQSLSASN